MIEKDGGQIEDCPRMFLKLNASAVPAQREIYDNLSVMAMAVIIQICAYNLDNKDDHTVAMTMQIEYSTVNTVINKKN